MKQMLFVLIVIAMSAAFSVRPDYLGVQDTGSGSLPTIDIGISIDCATNGLSVSANANDSGEALDNANTYLFYTDYGYQALASGKTDANGISAITVNGKPNFLTGLFILRVDKQGYQSREIEFAYKKCFQAPPAGGTQGNKSTVNVTTANSSTNTTEVPLPKQNKTENISGTGTPTTNGTQVPLIEQNTTGQAPQQNRTQGGEAPTSKPPGSCLPAFLLALIALYSRR